MRALAVRPPRGRDVAAHGVRREEEHVAVAAAGQHDGVGQVGLDLTRDHVAGDDAAGLAVHDDQLEHLVACVGLDGTCCDLALERLVGADQQLLARLAAGVEGAGDLHTAEGPVVEEAAVLARERHALRHALVDDVGADLGEPIDVGLARAVVAALDRVVEQAIDRVAVLLVVLRGVDAALRGDRVRPARGVLVEERVDVVAGLAERRGGGRARQPGADHDDAEPAPVGGVHELGVEDALGPAPLDGSRGRLGVRDGGPGRVVAGRVVVIGRVSGRGRDGGRDAGGRTLRGALVGHLGGRELLGLAHGCGRGAHRGAVRCLVLVGRHRVLLLGAHVVTMPRSTPSGTRANPPATTIASTSPTACATR